MGGNFLAGSSNSLWAASAVLSPMIDGYGLCGAVPNNTNVTTRDLRSLTGSQPWRPCSAGVRRHVHSMPGMYLMHDMYAHCLLQCRVKTDVTSHLIFVLQ